MAVGYDSAFDWSQYDLLAKVMAESKGKVMLSINDHPDIRALFKDFRITQLELTYTVGRDKTGKTSGELAICNWQDKSDGSVALFAFRIAIYLAQSII